MILNFDAHENGCFIIYEFSKDLKTIKCNNEKRGDFTLAAVFISKDKMCVLEQSKELAVCNFDGSNLKKLLVNKKGPGKVDMIFPAPLGKILLFCDESLQLYDISARKVMFEIACTDVKQVYWNSGFTHAAIVTKSCKQLLGNIDDFIELILVNKNLEVINS